MAKVGAIFKIYPVDEQLDIALKNIKEMNPKDIKVEEVAFGIKVIKALFVFEDSETGSSKIEEELKKVEGVEEVEVEQESLI